MEKINFLKERAESFLRDANSAFKEKRYFAVAFYLEQACQLYLKHYLFLKLKDFPKTHDLSLLLADLGRTYEKEKETKEFLKKNELVIEVLNQAYLTSRYLPVEFKESQIKSMQNFTKNLIKFLKNLWEKKSH